MNTEPRNLAPAALVDLLDVSAFNLACLTDWAQTRAVEGDPRLARAAAALAVLDRLADEVADDEAPPPPVAPVEKADPIDEPALRARLRAARHEAGIEAADEAAAAAAHAAVMLREATRLIGEAEAAALDGAAVVRVLVDLTPGGTRVELVALDVASRPTRSVRTVIVERLDDDEKGVNSIHTPGGS